MTLFSELQQLMVSYRFRPKKKLAQHFIISEDLIQRMLKEADLKAKDTVLEIGPGVGFLTQFLLEKSRVIGVELDEEMFDILEKRFSKNKNFKLLKGNFLSTKLPKFNKIVSFPPYHISGDILVKLFQEKFDLALLVFQREFCEKLLAEPGFKEYSYLSVLSDYLYEKEIVIRNIPPKSFYPKPEAYSSLLKLTRKNVKGIKDFEKFAFFVKNLFRYKNKDLSNSLKNCLKETHFKVDYDKALKIIQEAELDGVKTYLLTTEDFLLIFKKIFGE
ncbi:MAG TPA: ribosomal RNA small subunit methyltransferase A [bacterium]|nr:ribosomal RNA small subunit methyltransferase A [bacterium]